MSDSISENKRNYGIDLLRIVSMYLVVVLHVLGCGGILEATKKYSVNYYVAWFLETSAFCAVDIFAMISGYVMVNKKINLINIVPIWLNVFFYSSLITILFKIIPNLKSLYDVSTKELVKAIFFPVISRQYWYFTSYVGIFFLLPFVNKMLCALNKNEYKKLCITILVVYSLLPVIGLKKIDLFNMEMGYSTAWLFCCYIIGGYFNRFPFNLNKIKCFIIYIISIFCAWFAKFLSHFLLKNFLGIDEELDLFIDYTSIFIIISAISLLLLFSQIIINNVNIQKIISLLSSLAFSVYIIHVQPYVFNYILRNLFKDLADCNPVELIYKCLLFALLIFTICICIDMIRLLLFRILKINNIPKNFRKIYSIK